jgi:hypothetical protein
MIVFQTISILLRIGAPRRERGGYASINGKIANNIS